MWTDAVKSFRKVAVMAECLEALREIITNEPTIKHATKALLFTHLFTASIDVVYPKKLLLGFSATGALLSIIR